MSGGTADQVQFHFDPRCPWCFQASRWIRRLAELGEIRPTWSLYCLELANLKEGQDPVAMGTTARSATALRTAAAIQLATGSSDGVGAFYKALGDRVWLTSEPAADRDQAVRESAVEAGFDAELLDKAMADPGTWEEVMRQHYWLADARHGIGVPSVVLDGGSGPEIFGPVLSHLPSDDDARDLGARPVAGPLRQLLRAQAVPHAPARPARLEGSRVQADVRLQALDAPGAGRACPRRRRSAQAAA